MPMKRVANSAFDKNASHFTILRIVNTEKGAYGFAISDEGEDAYIPAPLIRKYNLTPLDEGAGFRALTRQSPPDIVNTSDKHTASMTIIPPMHLDDENPQYVASVHAANDPDAVEEMEAEITELLDRHEKLTGKAEKIDEALERLATLATRIDETEIAIGRLVMDSLRKLKGQVEDTSAALTTLHNDLTEEADWREEAYPNEPDTATQPVIVERQKLGLKLA